ncbi:hypothetical protein ES708_23502 [subsurface metagenome]
MTVPEVTHKETRWYKGKYKVKILVKSGKHFGVKALEYIPELQTKEEFEHYDLIFTTIARLCWRHPRK